MHDTIFRGPELTYMRPSAPQAIGEHARTYYLELFYVLLFMIYGVNYLLGRRTNEQIATAW